MKFTEIEDLEQTDDNIDRFNKHVEHVLGFPLQKGQSAEIAAPQSGPEKRKMNKKKMLGILAAVVAVLIALAVGLGIYNTPENRLARQLDLGARYLEEQNYAEAVLAFEKAIQIDERCMSAYDNGIQAYLYLDEPENLRTFYEKALEAARSLEEEALDSDAEAIVSIYLAAMDVYGDTDRVLELWEEGYEKSGQDGRLRDSLVDTYLERAKGFTADGNYEESLRDYDRMLELDGQNEGVQKGLADCLREYLDLLMEQGDFARVQELAEKYASALLSFDFKTYQDEIALREQMEADNRAFLQRIYELMSAENYKEMYELCWGLENEDMLAFGERLERMKVERYLYFPEDNDDQTGIGVGVYRLPNYPFLDVDVEGSWYSPPYYFYYGPYKNGSREGEGVSYGDANGLWGGCVFSGFWAGDAPNGAGRVYQGDYDEIGRCWISTGTLVDGLWDGYVNSYVYTNTNPPHYIYWEGETVSDISYTADKGIPVNRNEEYLSHPGINSDGLELDEDFYIYAFAFINKTDVWVSEFEGLPLGVYGFGAIDGCNLRGTGW